MQTKRLGTIVIILIVVVVAIWLMRSRTSPPGGGTVITDTNLPPIEPGVKADLVVHSVSGPSPALKGATITISDTTSNLPNAGSANTSMSKIYLATNYNYMATASNLTSHSVPHLDPTNSSTWSGGVQIPSNWPTGSSWMISIANANGGIAEITTSNNTNKYSITINAP